MPHETQSGRLVHGRYRLLELLGGGSFGRVWRARDEALDVDVAVKEVWLPQAMSPQEQAQRLLRAEREARNAARLPDHPNIVAVHDVVMDDDAPWIVMRLVDGLSLEERVREHGPLSMAETAAVASDLLGALGAAHDAEVVHRDVKPANVMLAVDGTVLLTDFGIAVHQADGALTAPGAFVGSVEYVAPERARGVEGRAAGDLFSLGVTLYQAVEGSSPFRRSTPAGTLAAVLLEEAPPPRHAGPLAPLLAGLMAKDPAERLTIPQARSLLRTSQRRGQEPTAVRPTPIAATPPPEPVPTPPTPARDGPPPLPPRSRRPWRLPLSARVPVAAAVVAVLVAAAAFVIKDQWFSSESSGASSRSGSSPTFGSSPAPDASSTPESSPSGTPDPWATTIRDPWATQPGDCIYLLGGDSSQFDFSKSAMGSPCAYGAQYKVVRIIRSGPGEKCADVPGWAADAGGRFVEDTTYAGRGPICLMPR
ncbi:serine/threonine-protein kinase [Embleya sp. NBC_00896]|uniref:serine/threonine-protein kinase n=1 Tax=Embleya sp. NBC_00896 TaxID=2975961 RepID=UPI00386C718C|nr:serine/threonine protein kinase [Embleya sp. NBC_00896]